MKTSLINFAEKIKYIANNLVPLENQPIITTTIRNDAKKLVKEKRLITINENLFEFTQSKGQNAKVDLLSKSCTCSLLLDKAMSNKLQHFALNVEYQSIFPV